MCRFWYSLAMWFWIINFLEIPQFIYLLDGDYALLWRFKKWNNRYSKDLYKLQKYCINSLSIMRYSWLKSMHSLEGTISGQMQELCDAWSCLGNARAGLRILSSVSSRFFLLQHVEFLCGFVLEKWA